MQLYVCSGLSQCSHFLLYTVLNFLKLWHSLFFHIGYMTENKRHTHATYVLPEKHHNDILKIQNYGLGLKEV